MIAVQWEKNVTTTTRQNIAAHNLDMKYSSGSQQGRHTSYNMSMNVRVSVSVFAFAFRCACASKTHLKILMSNEAAKFKTK